MRVVHRVALEWRDWRALGWGLRVHAEAVKRVVDEDRGCGVAGVIGDAGEGGVASSRGWGYARAGECGDSAAVAGKFCD